MSIDASPVSMPQQALGSAQAVALATTAAATGSGERATPRAAAKPALPASPKNAPAFKSLSAAVGPELAQALLMIELGVGRMKDKMDTIRTYSGLKAKVQQEHDKKVVEQMEKAARAAKTGLLAKIFGWIAKIFMAIAAAVTAAVTLGTAGPVMAAAIAAMVLLAAYDIASSAAMEANKDLKIGLADGLGKMIGGLARLCGASDEQAKQAEQWGGMALAMVVQIAMSLGVMAPGAVQKAVSDAGKLLTDLGNFFIKLGTEPGRVLGESFKALGNNLPLLQKLMQKAPGALRSLFDDGAQAGAQTTSRAAGQSATRAIAASDEAAESGAQITEQAVDGRQQLSRMTRWSTNVQEGVGYLNATTSLGQGIADIINGNAHYKAGMAEAEAVEKMALLSWMEAVFDRQKDEIEYLAKEQSGITKAAQDMANQKSQTDASLTSNFGGGGMGSAVGFA